MPTNMRHFYWQAEAKTPGPWREEPDMAVWKDEASGYWCLIRRHDAYWTLNGYVGVSDAHPLYGLSMDDEQIASLEVHSGITFSDTWDVLPNLSPMHRRLWWIGFHCAHYMDRSPGAEHRVEEGELPYLHPPDTVYRDFPYVVSQVQLLACQLWAHE